MLLYNIGYKYRIITAALGSIRSSTSKFDTSVGLLTSGTYGGVPFNMNKDLRKTNDSFMTHGI